MQPKNSIQLTAHLACQFRIEYWTSQRFNFSDHLFDEEGRRTTFSYSNAIQICSIGTAKEEVERALGWGMNYKLLPKLKH